MKRKVGKVIDEQYFRHEGEYLAEGDLHITNNAKFYKLIVKGDLIVEGMISAEEIEVQGNFVAEKNVSTTNMHVAGNLKVNGRVCIDGDMYVNGNCEMTSFAPRYSNVYIGGKFKTEVMCLSSSIHYISIGYSVKS